MSSSVDLQINIAVGRGLTYGGWAGVCCWLAPFKCLSRVYLISVLGSLSSRANITKLCRAVVVVPGYGCSIPARVAFWVASQKARRAG